MVSIWFVSCLSILAQEDFDYVWGHREKLDYAPETNVAVALSVPTADTFWPDKCADYMAVRDKIVKYGDDKILLDDLLQELEGEDDISVLEYSQERTERLVEATAKMNLLVAQFPAQNIADSLGRVTDLVLSDWKLLETLVPVLGADNSVAPLEEWSKLLADLSLANPLDPRIAQSITDNGAPLIKT